MNIFGWRTLFRPLYWKYWTSQPHKLLGSERRANKFWHRPRIGCHAATRILCLAKKEKEKKGGGGWGYGEGGGEYWKKVNTLLIFTSNLWWPLPLGMRRVFASCGTCFPLSAERSVSPENVTRQADSIGSHRVNYLSCTVQTKRELCLLEMLSREPLWPSGNALWGCSSRRTNRFDSTSVVLSLQQLSPDITALFDWA